MAGSDALPGGVVLRRAQPEDAAGIAQVQVDTWHASYRGIVPDSYLARLTVTARGPVWERAVCTPVQGTGILVGAHPEAGIVAFAAFGPERGADPELQGELYAIYVLPAWQRRGLGRRLLWAAADGLQRQGLRGMLVWVLADNRPARRFYAALGGLPWRERTITLDGVPLAEVGYGWAQGAAGGRAG